MFIVSTEFPQWTETGQSGKLGADAQWLVGEGFRIDFDHVPIPGRPMEGQTALEKGEKFVNAIRFHVQVIN